MTHRPRLTVWATLLGGLSLGACALTSKSETSAPRFYTPESLGPSVASAARPRPAAPLSLKLGRVNAAADLKDAIAYRDRAHEVGYYEDLLWTEHPDAYLSRALVKALFGDAGLRHVVSGPAPTLDVRLLAFEEIRGEAPRVRIRVAVTLHDELFVRLEATLTQEEPLRADHRDRGDAVAEALGVALGMLAHTVADQVAAELAKRDPSLAEKPD